MNAQIFINERYYVFLVAKRSREVFNIGLAPLLILFLSVSIRNSYYNKFTTQT